MALFTSPHRKFAIYDSAKGIKVKFTPIGAIGSFQTEDEQLADYLRKHPMHGRKFAENALPKKQETNIVQGVRSAATSVQTDEYIRFGELKALLLKKDGSYRKDATEELINEYEQLKKGLGV